MAHEVFCHTAISQCLVADISFNIACKELKIDQIAQLNQLFQLLHLVHIYGHGFCELSRMLMRKNGNNDVSKDSPIAVVLREIFRLCLCRILGENYLHYGRCANSESR